MTLNNLTPEHHAVARVWPPEQRDAALGWAAEQRAPVRGMIAWRNQAYGLGQFAEKPEPEGEVEPKPKRQRNKGSTLHSEAPARANGNQTSASRARQDIGSAREPVTPPPLAINSEPAPAYDHTRLITIRVTPGELREVVWLLSARINCDPPARPLHADSRPEAIRLRDLMRSWVSSGPVNVTLPLADWYGVPCRRISRPGLLGLLDAISFEHLSAIEWTLFHRVRAAVGGVQ
jgi:hypothetical protein